MTSKIEYLGDLRTSAVHVQSGTTILSDAPIDNHGKGEAFSPTDLVANALGSCIMTIMAIKAKDLELNIEGSTIDVTKIMQTEPRRIGTIILELKMNARVSTKERLVLERVAMNCPVFHSLNPDIKKEISFSWL
ncbi:MAG: hypothetical protein RLZZ312_1209 [Bacteroidota bacterium]